MLALQGFHQARAAQHLGIEPLGRQKQDGEIGGEGRLHVFLGNRLCLQADALLQRLSGGVCGHHVGARLGVEQALVIFVGKLGVNRQPERLAGFGLARQLDGKVHRVFAARARGHLDGVLIGHQHLFQQRGQLRLPEHPAGLDIGQQMLEIAHALGE